ncbi:MAG TPA: protein DA1, partial [Candidatus Binatia bacterium]|nr:protein DA1 [Candidatus Binatia bacterium]
EGVRNFHEVRDSLDRLFARFSGFPEKNITVAMVDRIHLQELFTLAGNDYHCPNVFGYTQSETNGNRIEHRISLMTGLPLSWFQATCAHELSHAWVAENVPPKRRQRLVRETEEGFCELVAFLYSDSRNDEAEKAKILRNAYTRGQIDLFVAAHNSYGLNDVLDWMRYGTDPLLSSSDATRIHSVALPQQKRTAPVASFPMARVEAPPAPTTLVLKAVIWDAKRPLALINDRTFGVQEEGKVHLGTTNVTVRCLAIRQNSVRIQVNGTPGEQELLLKAK